MKLTKALEERVAAQVKAGPYASAEEYLSRALDHYDQYEHREEIQRAVAEGQAELDAGEGIPAEEVFAEIRKQSQERRRNG